jgi:hypothetical protein
MPTNPPCFPDDPDWLDGRDEINLPSTQLLRAYWDTDILDVNGVPPATIIRSDEEFQIRFRVELVGRLWKCICADWIFDVGFSAIGAGPNFDLSQYLPNKDDLEIKNWRGCDTLCIDRYVRVPAGTIPTGPGEPTRHCAIVYEVAAKFCLRCCDGHIAAVGYEALEEYEFYFEPA